MGKALAVDWEKLRSDFQHGVSFEEIADRYAVNVHTVKKRAQRYLWNPANPRSGRMADIALKSYVGASLQAAKPKIDAVVESWISNSKHAAEALVAKVSAIVPKTDSPDDLTKLATTLDKADVVGRRALGLDVNALQAPIQINVGLQIVSKDGERVLASVSPMSPMSPETIDTLPD